MPEIGDEFEAALRFTQGEFDEFARISGDDNPIHVDPRFAARTRFGKTVAHGMMLFGFLDAAVGRWLDEPGRVLAQELTFRAPTFADDDLKLSSRLESVDGTRRRIVQRLQRSDGIETAAGFTVIGMGAPPRLGDAPQSGAGQLSGIRAGMRAAARRTITAADVVDYCTLVGDAGHRYDGVVPPALLGGLVSHLLGVELPGRGTNWLRPRYRFLEPVPVGREISTEVRVIRVRPDKALVDLATTCSIAGRPVVAGESLVLIADLEAH